MIQSIRGESQARTRRRLMEAAAHEISARGFSAASVRDIAERAGFSQGAFYSNFATKDALLLEIASQLYLDASAELYALLERTSASAALAMDEIENWLRAISSNPRETLLTIEIDLYAKRHSKFAREYGAIIEEHKRTLTLITIRLFELHGVRPPAPAAEIAAGLFALTRGLALVARSDKDYAPGSTLITFLRAVLVAGIA